MKPFIRRETVVLAFLWGASATLVLSLVGYLLGQGEDPCPLVKNRIHPIESCGAWVVKGAHIP